MAPATVALLLLAWTVAAGQPCGLDGRGPGRARLHPLSAARSRPLGGPPPQQPWRVFLRVAAGGRETALAQAGLQLTFLASQAWELVHAIVLTLVRLAATQRRLLEWETAAASAERGRRPRSGARASS